MGRQQVVYSQEELNRPSKYIIVVCDRNIDTHIVDIEEGNKYVEKYQRRAIIVTSKTIFKNKELNVLKYNFVMNATTPALRLIDHNGQSYKVVYDYLNSNFKNGLVIAHDDTLTNIIADALAQNSGKGLDYIVYRQDLMSLSGHEINQVNYIRFHANSEFSFTAENMRHFVEKFGEGTAIGIFTAQMIANAEYNISQEYFDTHVKKFKSEGFEDCIDYYELNKQMAYHVYFDTLRNKILGVSKEMVAGYMRAVFQATGNKPMFNKADEWSEIYT